MTQFAICMWRGIEWNANSGYLRKKITRQIFRFWPPTIGCFFGGRNVSFKIPIFHFQTLRQALYMIERTLKPLFCNILGDIRGNNAKNSHIWAIFDDVPSYLQWRHKIQILWLKCNIGCLSMCKIWKSCNKHELRYVTCKIVTISFPPCFQYAYDKSKKPF